jgi:hypothetical protein
VWDAEVLVPVGGPALIRDMEKNRGAPLLIPVYAELVAARPRVFGVSVYAASDREAAEGNR